MPGFFEGNGWFGEEDSFLTIGSEAIQSGVPLDLEEEQSRQQSEGYDPNAILGPTKPGHSYWAAQAQIPEVEA